MINGRLSSESARSILHIGAVAANSIINSKLLIERGYESHVAANDIYHCVSSPEWQELGSTGLKLEQLGDAFFPNFFRIAGARDARPKWFAQGPQFLTIYYLHALKSGRTDCANIVWRTLQYNRFKAVLFRTTVPERFRLDGQEFRQALQDLSVADVFKDELQAAFEAELVVKRFCDFAAQINGQIDPKLLVPPFTTAYIDSIIAFNEGLAADIGMWRSRNQLDLIGFEMPDWAALREKKAQPMQPGFGEASGQPFLAGRSGSVDVEDAKTFASVMPAWNALLELYDHRLFYGGSAVLGLLSDADSYMAYEHGTIRSIPFDSNPVGRLTKAAYEQADAVFITNTDYVTATRRIEFRPEQRVYVPHAFDERPLLAFSKAYKRQERTDDTIVLFSPSRQDWVLDDPRQSKANHLIVEAAADLVATGDSNFEVTFVAWGDDLAATKALIAERGLDRYFHWVDPLSRIELWKRYIEAHAVLDQFLISGLSGVTFEALTLGCRVITKDDGIGNKEFFGVAPPFLAAGTAEQIAGRVRELMVDPADRRGVGKASQQWALEYHSGARFVELQERQFERILESDRANRAAAFRSIVVAPTEADPLQWHQSFARLGSYFWPITSNARNSAEATVGNLSIKR